MINPFLNRMIVSSCSNCMQISQWFVVDQRHINNKPSISTISQLKWGCRYLSTIFYRIIVSIVSKPWRFTQITTTKELFSDTGWLFLIFEPTLLIIIKIDVGFVFRLLFSKSCGRRFKILLHKLWHGVENCWVKLNNCVLSCLVTCLYLFVTSTINHPFSLFDYHKYVKGKCC